MLVLRCALGAAPKVNVSYGLLSWHQGREVNSADKTDCRFNCESVFGTFCNAQDMLKFSGLAEEDALSSQQSRLPFSQ